MTNYEGDFWTEERCLQQHAALRNIIFNPERFPKADLDAVGDDLEQLEYAMLQMHPTMAVLKALTT